MNRDRKEEENRRVVQIIILFCYVMFAIGISVVSFIRAWELWFIPVLLVGGIVCVSLHYTDKLDFRYRIYVFAGFMGLALFFYGAHEEVINYFSIVAVLAIMIFSATEEKGALRIILVTYLMLIIYHAILILIGRESTARLIPTICILNIIAVIVANRVGSYICEVLLASHNQADELENSLIELKRRTEDFMANVSHELRTPINVVMGLTSILIKGEKDRQKTANLVAIQSAGHRLFGRIEDILDYTEIDTGNVVLSNDEYRISSIINDIAMEFRNESGDETAEFIIDMDVNIPARMIGDQVKIKRIIRHLVNNAMKFTDAGGCVYLKVYTRKKEYGVNLCIEVTDNGIGMSEDELSRVKTAAYQSDSGRNRRAEGIGLGLTIVYGFVRVMGGFVCIDSVEKKGTTVKVSLPQKVTDDRSGVVADHSEKMSVATCYNPAGFASLTIREYCINSLHSCMSGLGIPMLATASVDELRQLMDNENITHVITGGMEYTKNRVFFDELAKEKSVVVIAGPEIEAVRNTSVTFLKKPVFSYSLVGAINREYEVWEFDPDSSGMKLVFDNVRTLVVDDEEMNLIVAKGILSDYGMEVTLAHSGAEAVHECERARYDVIFMDHMMPEMDGIEAMKLIRNNYGHDDHTAIIAFTANAVSGVREMFIREGFDEFIAKPIETSELERILKKVLPSNKWQYEDIEEENTPGEELSEEGNGKYGFSVIDEAEGIKNCRNSDEFYEEILGEFAKESDEMLSELQYYFDRKDWKNYGIKLNGLKLSARLIGASALSREAHEIERAAMQSWEAYVVANHEALGRHMAAVNRDIGRIYGGDAS